MSVSAASPTLATSSAASTSVYNPVEALIPVLPSENAETARASGMGGEKTLSMFAEEDGPSFDDLLDVINPLQHIPLVNDFYREETGDKIGVGARLVGGALFGGPLGLMSAAINCVMEESSGATPGGHLLALFRDEDPTASDTRLAQASTPTPGAATTSDTVAKATGETVSAAPVIASAPQAATESTVVSEATASKNSGRGRPVVLDNLIGTEAPAPSAMPRASLPVTSIAPPAATTAQAETSASNNNPATLAPVASTRPLKMPERTVPLATRDPPRLTTAPTTNTARSHIPVTGLRPQGGLIAPNAAGSMVTAQSEAGATVPVTSGPSLSVSTESATPAAAASPAKASTPGGSDWFTAAMSKGLDKYERSSGRKVQGDSAGVPTSAPAAP